MNLFVTDYMHITNKNGLIYFSHFTKFSFEIKISEKKFIFLLCNKEWTYFQV